MRPAEEGEEEQGARWREMSRMIGMEQTKQPVQSEQEEGVLGGQSPEERLT